MRKPAFAAITLLKQRCPRSEKRDSLKPLSSLESLGFYGQFGAVPRGSGKILGCAALSPWVGRGRPSSPFPLALCSAARHLERGQLPGARLRDRLRLLPQRGGPGSLSGSGARCAVPLPALQGQRGRTDCHPEARNPPQGGCACARVSPLSDAHRGGARARLAAQRGLRLCAVGAPAGSSLEGSGVGRVRGLRGARVEALAPRGARPPDASHPHD
mmetsp:Transcript_16261/g.38546  ORF Transcript_16261/g.38546 Transcript_16261/m.38546 type:complete len:215 (+) Transcript_16261:1816-2460(+)